MSSVGPSYEQLAVLVVEQAATIRRLEGEVVELKAEVADLKRRLAGNSRNSSRPPSSDGLAKPAPRSLRRPSGRKPGGQSGHEGGHLSKAAVVDEVVDRVPSVCAGCDGDLSGAADVGHVARQVFDLPEIRLWVCEHRARTRRCGCGHETTAVFPDDVRAPAQYGPRVRALGIYLVARQHLPYERAAQLLEDWFGARLSTGTLSAFVAQGARDLEPFLDEVHRQIRDAPLVHLDETGGRVAGRLGWLHVASTSTLTFYALHERRGTVAIDAIGLLGGYTGVAMHDGWVAYRQYPKVTHALCNAHHLRELQGVIEQHRGRAQSWAGQMDRLLRKLNAAVRSAREHGNSSLDPAVLAKHEIRYEQIIALGQRQNPPPTTRTGKRGPIKKTAAANLLLRLDRDREHALRFAHDFQVPFDNNQAERDIRMVKLQQKISGCWRTITGAEQFLALRAYLSTARKQQQPTADTLTALATGNPWLPAT